MKSNCLILCMLCFAIITSSCTKEEQNLKDGIYKGTFKVSYSSGTQTGQTTLEIKDNKFVCSGNPNRIPAGGSGSYSFSNNSITFNDQNVWTADFDWNLILNGQCNYTFDGKKLKIIANKNGTGVYEYELEKQ